MITRRQIVLGLSLLGASGLRAQPASPEKQVRVGVLEKTTAAKSQRAQRRLAVDMRELGWAEGRNVVYDTAYANDDAARLPALAAALVGRRPNVIYTTNTEALQAVLARTRTIPVVMASLDDPAEFGIYDPKRPGGNVTGITSSGIELGAKRLQLLKQALPGIVRAGVLTQPQRPSSLKELKLIEEAAAPLDVAIISAGARTPADLDAALAALFAGGAEAVLTTHQELFVDEQKRIVDLATRRGIPVVAHRTSMAFAGALIAYGADVIEQIRHAAQLVDKILKGAKPADVPVEAPPRLDLTINLKAARALGITISPSMALQADREIR